MRPDEQWAAATPSFEAYRLFAEGTRLYYEADIAGALRLSRSALVLDPDFAAVWRLVAFCYSQLDKPDSAALSLTEALGRPQRLTPPQRLLVQGDLAKGRGDAREAMTNYDRVIRWHPGSLEASEAFNGEELLLSLQGRYEEALEANAHSIEAWPIAPTGVMLYNRAIFLLALGRRDEARAVARRLDPERARRWDLELSLAEGRWDIVDSMAIAYERERPGAGIFLVRRIVARADVAAARGQIDAAEAQLRRAEGLRFTNSRLAAARAGRTRALLAMVRGRPAPRPRPWLERDSTASALITRTFLAAAAGDTAGARALLTALRARPTARLGTHGSTPEFLEACIASRAGRWSDVVGLIARPARNGSDRGSTDFDRIGVAPERWLVARAYEQLGQPDSAAAFYSRILFPNPGSGGVVRPFALLRLVMLYARTGRIEDAERHLAILERDFTNPDPDVRRLLEEARSAVRGARGMARSAAGRT